MSLVRTRPIALLIALTLSVSGVLPPTPAPVRAATDAFLIAYGDAVADGMPAPGAGNLEVGGAVDSYSFEADAGDVAILDALAGGAGTFLWRLETPAGVALFDAIYVDRAVDLPETGTYVLSVRGATATTVGTYSFRLLRTPPPEEFTIAFGDTVSDGVPAGGAGSLERPGAVDRYRFDASAGQVAIVDALTGSTNQVRWSLSAPDGTELFDSLYVDRQVTVPAAGTYTLTVYGLTVTSFGGYSFRLIDVPPRVDEFTIVFGDTVSDGVPGPGAGNLEGPGAVDRYHFDAMGGQVALIDALSDSTNDVRWSLQAPDGSVLFDSLYVDREVTLPDSGTYTLTVNGLTVTSFGVYSFALREGEANRPPTIEPIADQESTVGDEIMLEVLAADPDGDDLTHEADGLPPGLQIDPRSGEIHGTVEDDADAGSPYTVEITVRDPAGASATAEFLWLVRPAATAQTITFPQPPSPQAFGITFSVAPAASSGLPVTVSASGGCTAAPAASGYDVTMTSGTTSCVLTASQPGDDDFDPAPEVERVVAAAPADAAIDVRGVRITYDGTAHGATGTATGVLGEDLIAGLDLGDTFTDVAGGTAHWTFTDPDGNYRDDAGSVEIVIDPATTTIEIHRIDPEPSVLGAGYEVTWSLSVVAPGDGTPTGTVTVEDGDGNGCIAAVGESGCTLPTSSSPGIKTVTATYGGDGNFLGSTATVDHAVAKRSTITTVVCAPGAIGLNGTTTCEATVTDVSPGDPITPSGPILLTSDKDGTFIPCVLSGTGDTATCVSTYTVGEVALHTVTAQHPESGVHLGSSGTGTVDVGYVFHGFSAPLSDAVVNTVTAGQTIPVKWRITDANGVAIDDPSSFVGVYSTLVTCGATASSVDVAEPSAGTSGLQYNGDGNWQYNWKTPRDYRNHCRTLYLVLADDVSVYGIGSIGADREVDLRFR